MRKAVKQFGATSCPRRRRRLSRIGRVGPRCPARNSTTT